MGKTRIEWADVVWNFLFGCWMGEFGMGSDDPHPGSERILR